MFNPAFAGEEVVCPQCGSGLPSPCAENLAPKASAKTWAPPVLGSTTGIIVILGALIWALMGVGVGTGDGEGALSAGSGTGAGQSGYGSKAGDGAVPVPQKQMGFAEVVQPKKPSPTNAGTSGASGGSDIFDMKGAGKKVVFVIDCSSSMRALSAEGSRLDSAKIALINSIRGLQPDIKFSVIFYNSRAIPMPGAKLVSATQANKTSTIAWIKTIASRGGTEPVGAMMQALNLKPDTVWLLSDGLFGPNVAGLIGKANKGATINTIAFHDPRGEVNLKMIAAKNRGKYRFVQAN